MITETRYFAVDDEGTKWTLKATDPTDAKWEVEDTFYLRKVTVKIVKVTTTTVWSSENA